MQTAAEPFWVPLTLPTLAVIHSGTTATERVDLVEQSCSKSQASAIFSWGISGNDVLGPRGVVVGCSDGSLYIFHPPHVHRNALQQPSRPSSSISMLDVSRPITPLLVARRPSRSNPSSSRSTSPSSLAFHHTAFSMTPRSQAVSGLCKQQVEAPTNYVDFDDEADKLKGMLKGKGLRDKTIADHLLPNFDKGLVVEKSPPPSLTMPPKPTSKRKDDPRSLLSASNSPSFTAISLSTSSSPKLPPSATSDAHAAQNLALRCHVIPRRPRTICALRLVSHDRLLIALQENGDLSVLKPKDGMCLAFCETENWKLRASNGNASIPEIPKDIWVWKRLCVIENGESILLLACAGIPMEFAAPSETENDSKHYRAHVYLYELFPGDEQGSSETKLEPLGHWSVDGSVESVGLHREADGAISFFWINPEGHFITQNLRILPRMLLPLPNLRTPESSTLNLPSLPLPNPFKKQKSDEVPLGLTPADAGRAVLGDVIDGGLTISQAILVSSRVRVAQEKLLGLIWTEEDLITFEWYHHQVLRVTSRCPMPGIRDMFWVNDNSYVIVFEGRCESYTLSNADTINDPAVQSTAGQSDLITQVIRPKLINTIKTGTYEALQVISASEMLVTTVDQSGRREVKLVPIEPARIDGKPRLGKLWSSRPYKSEPCSNVLLTAVLPLDLNIIILGYDDGLIRRSSLARMAERLSSAQQFSATSNIALNGYIVGLHIVENDRTKERFIVGGSDDGCLAFWSYDSLELCTRWTVFTTPLHQVTQFRGQQAGPLTGCVLCVSQDGTIVVIVIDGFQFLHLVPGSVSPLQRICVGGNNLLLMYTDGRVRLWDIQTAEFWRSTSIDKAEELIGQGGWIELSLAERSSFSSSVFGTLPEQYRGIDAVSTILIDLEAFISEATTSLKVTDGEIKASTPTHVQGVRTLLSAMLTNGINGDIDTLCQKRMGITPASVSTGMTSFDFTIIFAAAGPQDPWCVSPEFSASLAVRITALLRLLGLFDELSDDCNTVITFYATSLVQAVGSLYQPPNIVSLVRYWFTLSSEVRQSARILFDAAVARLSDEETIILAEQWQHDLPCLQPDAEKELAPVAMSLFLCGYIAAEKYSLLSTSTLTDISKSIAMYLHDEKSLYRVLAIDLCSRGYHIWQHYVDAMEMLRALFLLATSSRKESITTQNAGPQARLAVLQIAASNTPLFMTTLGLDILHPRSVEHRKSTMQLVAFLIRKRPLVLYPNLPRLMEAVVKSLDPNSTASREAVLDAATEILGHVVKTFPTVDFYMPNQRLAVGTSEGAVVMYDLKTATRLYVLEGHKKRPAACSFSPDGRRLVTVSLEEGVVLVWKVGSSFASFFTPGVPPRQGHGGSEPFKTLTFNVGDAASMSIAATLESVRFEWTAERSVRLSIRESVLTFST